MIPDKKQEIQNKSTVNFRIYDLPNILAIPSAFMDEMVKLPSDSPIFSTQFLHDILEYKWQYYIKKYFLW